VTANAMSDEIEESESVDFSDYLCKPVDMNLLHESLEKVFKK